MERFTKAIIEDKSFYVLILIYGMVVLVAAISIGDLRWFGPLSYFGLVSKGAMVFGLAALARHTMAQKRVSPETWAGIVLFTWITVFLGLFTSMKTMMPSFASFRYDPLLADIDGALHGNDPWVWLTWLNPITSEIAFLYGMVWPLVLSGMTLWICLARTEFRAQYIWTLFACWIVLGNIIPLSMMAGGPIFYDRLVGSDRFAGLMADLARSSGPAAEFPGILWEAYVNSTPGAGLGISAFPSLHVSMATLFALTGLKLGRWIGRLLIAYLVFIQVASVHLGWHYAIDGYASIVATALIWKLVGSRRFEIGLPIRTRAGANLL